MEAQFFCTACASEHDEPADARLGHLVMCLDCALIRELDSFEATLEAEIPVIPVPARIPALAA
jgi:hypothetical protein